MYPKNAASPEPIAIGAVIQISDGAVQTAGCTVRIKPIGVAEADGAGTTAYSTDGIVYYTPTQTETNYTSFILIAKKTACLPIAITIVTTSSSTPGTVLLAPVTHTSAVIPTVTTLTNLPTIPTNWLTAAGIAADAITDAKVAADVTIASVTGAVGSVTGNVGGNVVGSVGSVTTVSDKTGYSLTATTGLGNQTSNITGNLSGSVGSVTGAVGSVATGGIVAGSIAATALNGKGDWNVGKTGYALTATTGLGNQTGAVGSVTAGVTVTTNNDKTGYGLSGAAVQAIWDALTSALTTVGSIGKLLVDNINATISSRSTYAGGDTSGTTTILGRIIGTLATGTHNPQTGDSFARLGAPVGASISADIQTRLATSGYTAPPSSATIAAAVWDLTVSGHTTSGTFGAAMNAAGAAGDPWSTSLPGVYGVGTAGYIVGTNINTTISSRLATASYSSPPSAVTISTQVASDLAAAHDAGSWATATGFATPTNITAATGIVLSGVTHTGAVIPTVTNLTNAPTVGDFTATMKTSITAAVPTAAVISTQVAADLLTAHGSGSWIAVSGFATAVELAKVIKSGEAITHVRTGKTNVIETITRN